MQNGWAVIFGIHKQFFSPHHVARQAVDEERKLQNSHYDGKKKWWDWDMYDTLHKEQHKIIESFVNDGYSEVDKGTKVCHFLKGVKSTELEAVVNVVQTQPEKYGKDVDTAVSYLDQIREHNAICPYCKDQKSASKAYIGTLHVEDKVFEISQGSLKFHV